MESQQSVTEFKLDFRLLVLQRLVLANLFLIPVTSGRLTSANSLKAAKKTLQLSSQAADQALEEHYRGDPARVALYADEAKWVPLADPKVELSFAR